MKVIVPAMLGMKGRPTVAEDIAVMREILSAGNMLMHGCISFILKVL